MTRLSPPEPRTGVPPDPIVYFTGRQEELTKLRQALLQHGRVATFGLGGVGKTQLAVQYIQRNRADYHNGTFWLRGDRASTLTGDLASLAWRLNLPERELIYQELIIEAVVSWLSNHQHWLLVIDNLDEPAFEAVNRLLPPGLRGHILVTTRVPIWAVRLELGPLPIDVATRFLLARTGQSDVISAEALCDRLGCLPLALEQASAYLDETGEQLAGYLRLLAQASSELLQEGTPEDHPEPVARTWQVAFQRVEQRSPAAADLMRLCAFLGPDEIPIHLLRTGARADKLGEVLNNALSDDLKANRAIAVLRRYSLVTRQVDRLSIHRLVQEVVRYSVEVNGTQSVWTERALDTLIITVPAAAKEPVNWGICHELAPHVLSAVDLSLKAGLWPIYSSELLNRIATYFWARAEYEAAKPLHERALKVREQTLGRDHPDTAISLNNLAVLLQDSGDLEGAQTLCERALNIRQRVLGANHPDTATSLNNLGRLRQAQAQMDQAKNLFERALELREGILGSEDPLTAESLNNLGLLLRDRGEFAAARPLYERALDIRERVLGSDHRDTATSLNNLASLLQDLGQFAAARPLYERALDIRERVLGSDHPDTATSLNNLANLLQDLGEFTAARPLCERALDIRERILGPNHRRTGQSLGNLASLLQFQEELAAARPLFERALSIYERVLGPEHPYTGTGLNNLGRLLYDQGEFSSAQPLCERALSIYERALGFDHPYTATSLNNLGLILKGQGRLEEAKELFHRALQIREKVLGSLHIETAITLNNIARVLLSEGEVKTALPLLDRAVQIFERTIGPHHPTTIHIKANRVS